MERATVYADLVAEFGEGEVLLETDLIQLIEQLATHVAYADHLVPVRASQALLATLTLAARATSVVNSLPVSEFRDLLETAAQAFPTKKAFARAIGITPGRLSRVLGGEHSLDVGNCLTLAKLTGESPSRVLRVAGKPDIADAIEALYGPSAAGVSPKERELLDAWDAVSQHAREGLWITLMELATRDAGQDTTVSEEHARTRTVATAARVGKTRTDTHTGKELEGERRVPDVEVDPISGAPRTAVQRAAATFERLTRDTEQAAGLDEPARPARRPRQPAAATRARTTGRRPPAAKHRR